EAVGQPVRHAVAEHHDIALRGRGGGVVLGGRRRAGEILAHHALRLLLLERREQFAAEPAAKSGTLLRLRPRGTAEIEKLGGSRSRDPKQQRGRDRHRDQRAGLAKHPEKRFWLGHALWGRNREIQYPTY